jgi:hypothetical protein
MAQMTPELYGELLAFLRRFYEVILLDLGTGVTGLVDEKSMSERERQAAADARADREAAAADRRAAADDRAAGADARRASERSGE